MMNFALSLSILFLALCSAIYLRNTASFTKTARAVFSAGLFTSLLFYIFYLTINYFTGNGITSSAIYFANYGLSGAGFSEYTGIIALSTGSALAGAAISIWLFLKKTPARSTTSIWPYVALILLGLSLSMNPVTASITELFLEETREPTPDMELEFHRFYTLPQINQTSEPKNLVFIYAEGLERTYLNQTIFPNLTPNLLELESKSISFTNILQDGYSHHTIGGMVASQCGIPLISPSHANSMSGMDTYLESAICLGDLLHEQGYYLSYYGGASLEFAGKGKFYSTHQFDEITGREELLTLQNDSTYLTEWGLYDDALFDIIYDRFTELSDREEKTAMFLLTLDTHHPLGHPSRSCQNITYQNSGNSILDAVACSDHLISEFVKRIRMSEYGNDTVIVIASDHLALPNKATHLLETGNRRNLFIINTPDSKASTIDIQGLTMDIGATIIPYIGYSGEIGLGRNIPDITEPNSRADTLIYKLEEFKPSILQFWNFPAITESLKINAEQRTVNLDGREFKIPLLIEFDDELMTKLNFEFTLPPEMSLLSQASNLRENQSFILIDDCVDLQNLSETQNETDGLCLLFGNKDNRSIRKVKVDTQLTSEEIRNMTTA